MIFKFDWLFREQEKPMIPYGINWLEDMHQWETRRRYAWFPKRLWKFEDRSSVTTFAPDEYRMFTKTRYLIWFSHYTEIVVYPRYINLMGPKEQHERFAVDELDYAMSIL